MNPIQNTKFVEFSTEAAIATNATSSQSVDTWDGNGEPFENAAIYVVTAASAATNTSAKWNALVLGHATTTHISNATAIDGCTGTTNATATSAQFVINAHNLTAVKQVVEFQVPLSNKERYLHLTANAWSAAYATVSYVAVLSRGLDTGSGAALKGASTVVYVTA